MHITRGTIPCTPVLSHCECLSQRVIRQVAGVSSLKEYRGAQFTQCQLMGPEQLLNQPTHFKMGQLYLATWNQVDQFQNGRKLGPNISTTNYIMLCMRDGGGGDFLFMRAAVLQGYSCSYIYICTLTSTTYNVLVCSGVAILIIHTYNVNSWQATNISKARLVRQANNFGKLMVAR